MKFLRKRNFKKRNELSFAKTELMRISLRESMSMFSELMETEMLTGEKTQKILQSKVSDVSRSMLKAVNEEYRQYLNYAFDDEELYIKQLKRRNALFLWLKDYLLDLESVERQLLRDKRVGRLDLSILKKFFIVSRSDEKEFGVFNDFFNKYLEHKKSDDLELKETNSDIKPESSETAIKEEEKVIATESIEQTKKPKKREKKGSKQLESNDVPSGQIYMPVGIMSSLKEQ